MRPVVIRGDARHLPLPDASVDLIVTSPPFLNLRDYRDGDKSLAGQIGTGTRDEFLGELWQVTEECKRVLKPQGSMFVELGDSYTNKSLNLTPARYAIGCADRLGLYVRSEIIWNRPNGLPESVTDRVRRSHSSWVHLVKQPRYFAAVDEIREPQLRTGGTAPEGRYQNRSGNGVTHRTFQPNASFNPLGKLPGSVWTVATEPLQVPAGIDADHFAAYPTEWPRRLILGWSPSGICTACGEGRRPVVTSVALNMDRPQARRAHELAERAGLTEAHLGALLSVGVSDTGRGAATQSGTGKNTDEVYALAAVAREALGGYAREYLLRRPSGFGYTCACPEPAAPTRPSTVVDPFGGTGTTAHVAAALGRIGVTVDLSGGYSSKLAASPELYDRRRRKVLGLDPPPKPEPQIVGQLDIFAGEPA